MTPAEHAALPDRERLAKTLLARVHSERGPTAYVPKTELYTYVTAAEDTIEQQAKALVADMEEFGRQVEHGSALMADIERLRTENTSLRRLAAAAVNAAQLGDRVSIETIRQALERTT
jgi:SepF-like predicted cell division protein (DUF552 family)